MTKLALLAAAAAVLTTAAAAPAAQADEVEIRNAVARVVVIPEARSDIQVTVDQGSSGLPALEVTRRGGDVIIEGGLRNRVQNCRSSTFVTNPTEMPRGVTVTVRDHGQVDVADAPLIVVRTPMDVEVSAGSAVWGSIGRASSVELGAGGCGDWTVANTDGSLSVSIGGSGSVRTGTAGSAEVNIGGSGSARVGAVNSAEVNIGGSGDAIIASVDGPVETNIGGSGEIRIQGGRASSLEAAIAGSGSVIFDGEAGELDAAIVGSGDVRVQRVTGRVDRTIMGSGEVRIGGR